MIKPLYLDFIRFLGEWDGRSDPYPLYRSIYFDPHAPVLEPCFETFNPLALCDLPGRVRAIHPSHYAPLMDLGTDLASFFEDILASVPFLEEKSPPAVLAMVGFLFPEGAVIRLKGEWTIVLGLERHLSRRGLKTTFLHELAHLVRRRTIDPEPAPSRGEVAWSEGTAFHLVERVLRRRDPVLPREESGIPFPGEPPELPSADLKCPAARDEGRLLARAGYRWVKACLGAGNSLSDLLTAPWETFLSQWGPEFS